MPDRLKVLMVEDSPDDAALVIHELQRAGLTLEWIHVETEADFLEAIKAGPDVIISDYSMPQFNGLKAIHLLRQHQQDTPFILISGTVGEDIAVEAMRHGATDYLLKDRIARLGPAVQKAIDQKRLRDQHRETERLRAELLHRKESFVRALGEIVYDHDVTHQQITWEGDTVRCIGWSLAELGAQVSGWTTRVHPDDLARVHAQLATLAIEPLFVSEYRLRHKAGHYVWIFDRGVMTRNAQGRVTRVIGIMWDITARKLAEESLRESETRFRQLAENIQEVFWMTDLTKNEMIYISPGYEKIWGRSCAELYHSPKLWLEAIHKEDRDRVETAILTKQSVGTYDEEYRIQRPDGSLRWVRDRAFPIRDADGKVFRIVGIAEDMTRQRQLEEQFRQVQKMEAVGQLASGVAHDFNNLLTVIRGGSELLLNTETLGAAEARELLHQIIATTDRAANLTRQLLLFSRKQHLQSQNLNLNELVENLTKLLRRIIGEDIRLRCEFGADLPLIQADPGMIEQVIMNLVVNARDAMPQGGNLTLRTSMDGRSGLFPTAALAIEGETYVCLNVSDTGTGIPEEILPRIFEPFFTTKAPGKGTGLGLATAYGIVQQHRGWMEVQSKLGAGTTFHIGLPAAQAASVNPAPATSSAAPLQLLHGTETILLVEDEASVRRLVRNVLERHGYQVYEADSGKSALKIWQDRKRSIDLLMTDMVMPDGITGLMLAEQLRQERPKLKIIFSSGYSADMGAQNFSFPPDSIYLQKPFNPQILLQTLRNYLTGAGRSI